MFDISSQAFTVYTIPERDQDSNFESKSDWTGCKFDFAIDRKNGSL